MENADMFQRKANFKPAALADDRINAMSLVKFFKAAKEDFTHRNKEDEAFVLEMLEDHFRNSSSTAYTSKIFNF
jgi:hypothetical protein